MSSLSTILSLYFLRGLCYKFQMPKKNGNKNQKSGLPAPGQPVNINIQIQGLNEAVQQEREKPGSFNWQSLVDGARKQPDSKGRVSHHAAVLAMAREFNRQGLNIPTELVIDSALSLLPECAGILFDNKAEAKPPAERLLERKVAEAAENSEMNRLRRSATQAQQTRDKAISDRNTAIAQAEAASVQLKGLEARNRDLEAQLAVTKAALQRLERGEKRLPISRAGDVSAERPAQQTETAFVPQQLPEPPRVMVAPALALKALGQSKGPQIDRPNSWSEFLGAFDSQPALSDRLFLTDKARREIEGQRNGLLKLSFDALCVMAGPYHEMRTQPGNQARVQAFKEALLDLHLANEPCEAAARGRPELYTTRVNGDAYVLNQHVKQTGRQYGPEHAFRMYHAEKLVPDSTGNPLKQRIVIGKMPGHMPANK